MDMFCVQLAGGYNSYEIINGANSYDIDSYVIALGGQVALGAGYLKGNIYTGENAGHLIWVDPGGMASTDGLTVLDNDVMGYLIVGGFKVNDMFSIEAGYAKVTTELDAAAGGTSTDDDTSSYYAQATVTLAPGVFFVPEVGIIDGEEVNEDEVTYFGVKWQINF